jgi:spore coat protein CotF
MDIITLFENTIFGGVNMITNVNLTTKERYLLEDARNHEEQCIRKYENCTNLACDDQLKAVFRANGQKEEEHLQTINQLLAGNVPSMGGGSQNTSQNKSQSTGQNFGQSGQAGGSNWQATSQQTSVEASANGSVPYKGSDKDLCTDMLMTEKYVSASYNTAIFEFKDAQVRDVLNHIQTEEQKHGEAIFAYMQSTGMYQAK